MPRKLEPYHKPLWKPTVPYSYWIASAVPYSTVCGTLRPYHLYEADLQYGRAGTFRYYLANQLYSVFSPSTDLRPDGDWLRDGRLRQLRDGASHSSDLRVAKEARQRRLPQLLRVRFIGRISPLFSILIYLCSQRSVIWYLFCRLLLLI